MMDLRMEKRLLVGISIPAMALSALGALCDTHYVSKVGRCEPPYLTPYDAASEVQDAMDVADPGDIVTVAEGEYEGPAFVPEGVSLRGTGPGRTLLWITYPNPEPYGPVLWVSAGAEARGLTIMDIRYENGLGVCMAGGKLADCEVVGCSTGVASWSGTETIEITDCVLWGNLRAGLSLDACQALVRRCLIAYNEGTGVFISGDDFDEASLEQCVIACNARGIWVEQSYYDLSVDHCTIVHNDGTGVEAPTPWDGSLQIDSTIAWHNRQPDSLPPEAAVTYSNLEFGNPGDGEGNIAADPGLVAWGPFDHSPNPMRVDGSYTGPSDGTSARPFGTIKAAVESYNPHLGYGSPCLGAGRNGTNMGAFPDEVPKAGAGATTVTISVAPGYYYETPIWVPSGVRVVGAGPERTLVTAVRSGLFHMASEAALQGLTISAEVGVYCNGGSPHISDCVIHARWGLWCEDSSPVITNSVVTRAVDERFGTGVSIWNSSPTITNCTFSDLFHGIYVLDSDYKQPSNVNVVNTIIWNMTPHHWNGIDAIKISYGNRPVISVTHSNIEGGWPGIGNTEADPQFLDLGSRDFRLSPSSPCIDAGDNSAPQLPETDIAGMHRIMFGGKSLIVDMGAYEYYINEVARGPGADEATLTWSSLGDKSYSIFYSDELLTWDLAEPNLPSAGNRTTSWTDDGSLTGVPPSLAARRFYRILENP